MSANLLPPHVDPVSGVITGDRVVLSTRKLAQLTALFQDQGAVQQMDPSTPVYTTYSLPETGLPELLYSTTILFPGRVGAEYFMTRGHFHVDPNRGEFNLTLRGKGAMILMDRDRRMSFEPMTPGSIHNLDGRLAHRVANVGNEPLIFLCVWMSDCGHDYETIASDGFAQRLLDINGEPGLR
ncbi:MAG: glucose-6-phosphate isomerase [Verrucomicrobia bacterium]|nr:glucose-6-phosphate isomerase [Verrucomicrobiota bacterium]